MNLESNSTNDSEPDSVPSTGRLAGVDFGTVRIGIAICDATQSLASPFDVYQRKDLNQDARYFRQLAENEDLAGFVIGLPVHMSGDESQKSSEARGFGKWLHEMTKLPIAFYDERLSTSMANELLTRANQTSRQQKKLRDMIAAQIILQTFIESSRSARPPESLD